MPAMEQLLQRSTGPGSMTLFNCLSSRLHRPGGRFDAPDVSIGSTCPMESVRRDSYTTLFRPQTTILFRLHWRFFEVAQTRDRLRVSFPLRRYFINAYFTTQIKQGHERRVCRSRFGNGRGHSTGSSGRYTVEAAKGRGGS